MGCVVLETIMNDCPCCNSLFLNNFTSLLTKKEKIKCEKVLIPFSRERTGYFGKTHFTNIFSKEIKGHLPCKVRNS